MFAAGGFHEVVDHLFVHAIGSVGDGMDQTTARADGIEVVDGQVVVDQRLFDHLASKLHLRGHGLVFVGLELRS